MLGLKLPSDPRWANIAKNNLQEILTDHAYCEQKAANSAISLVISFPEKSELVSVMLDIAKEEISHFQMVHKLILEMGFSFGRERKDEYVIKLKSFFPKGGKRNDHGGLLLKRPQFDMDPVAVDLRKIANQNYSNILYNDAKITRKY